MTFDTKPNQIIYFFALLTQLHSAVQVGSLQPAAKHTQGQRLFLCSFHPRVNFTQMVMHKGPKLFFVPKSTLGRLGTCPCQAKVVDGSYSKLENPHFLSFRRNHLEWDVKISYQPLSPRTGSSLHSLKS